MLNILCIVYISILIIKQIYLSRGQSSNRTFYSTVLWLLSSSTLSCWISKISGFKHKKIIWSFDLSSIYEDFEGILLFYNYTVFVPIDISSPIIFFLIFHYFAWNPIFGTEMLQMRLEIFFYGIRASVLSNNILVVHLKWSQTRAVGRSENPGGWASNNV